MKGDSNFHAKRVVLLILCAQLGNGSNEIKSAEEKKSALNGLNRIDRNKRTIHVPEFCYKIRKDIHKDARPFL